MSKALFLLVCVALAPAIVVAQVPTLAPPPALEPAPLPPAGRGLEPLVPVAPGGDPLRPTTPAAIPTTTEILTDARPGQQHWLQLNWSALQPFAGRVGVKVWERSNGSLWLEASGGSVLFAGMYGFGARMQYSAMSFANGDRLMVSPGLGAHVVLNWVYREESRYYYLTSHGTYIGRGSVRGVNDLWFLAADVDVSWVHEFSRHFAYELGFKFGLAGRLSGIVGKGNEINRAVMFSDNVYPIIAIYSGFRF